MAFIKHRKFLRRERLNGVDLICLKCYNTLAHADNPGELDRAEASHECLGANIGRLLHPEDPTLAPR
jgi:hypothetical protein